MNLRRDEHEPQSNGRWLRTPGQAVIEIGTDQMKQRQINRAPQLALLLRSSATPAVIRRRVQCHLARTSLRFWPDCLAQTDSLHFFKISRLPGAIENRLLRSVDAEIDKPTLVGAGPDPLPCFASRSLSGRSKIDRLLAGDVLQLEQRSQGCSRWLGRSH